MAVLDINRTLMTLSKNHVILAAVVKDVDQRRAENTRDGADGWSTLFVACHLLDYERIVARRFDAILTQDAPTVEPMDHLGLVVSNDYATQDFGDTLSSLFTARIALVDRLSGLEPAAFARMGTHPEYGPSPLLHFCVNACMHDINHIEQIVRCLA
jgi:hypothetical protein